MKFESKYLRCHASEIDRLTQSLASDMTDGWKPVGGPIVTKGGELQWVTILLTREVSEDPSKIVPRVS